MRKHKMAVTPLDDTIAERVNQTDHKTLAFWAADCAERVIHYFEAYAPQDPRPRIAIDACREWARTGVFRMTDVRGKSLAAHAAARDCPEGAPAHSAARAAGQAMATPHIPRHAIAAAIYAATAVRDATNSDEATLKERDWQYQHLLRLGETQNT